MMNLNIKLVIAFLCYTIFGGNKNKNYFINVMKNFPLKIKMKYSKYIRVGILSCLLILTIKCKIIIF